MKREGLECKKNGSENMSEMVEEYLQKILDFGINVVIAVVILLIGRVLIKLICRFFSRFFEKSSIQDSVSKFLLSLIRVILYIILVIIICDKIGIQTTSFIAVLGSAGLAVGLSLQGSLSNFAGGVLIILLKPFVDGDYIVSSLGEGTVESIDIFYTTLITADNKRLVIPNGQLADEPITDVTALPKRRLDITVGISYDSNIKDAREIVFGIFNKNPYVLSGEENAVSVTELGNSEIKLTVKAWVKTEDYWTAQSELNEQIKNEFDEAGIVIPYNQIDVHLKSDALEE